MLVLVISVCVSEETTDTEYDSNISLCVWYIYDEGKLENFYFLCIIENLLQEKAICLVNYFASCF